MQLIGVLKRIIKDAKNALNYIRKIYPRKKLNENKMWYFSVRGGN